MVLSLLDSDYVLLTMPVVLFLFYAHVVNNIVRLGAHSKGIKVNHSTTDTTYMVSLLGWLAFVCSSHC